MGDESKLADVLRAVHAEMMAARQHRATPKQWYERSPAKEMLAHGSTLCLAVVLALMIHRCTGAPVTIEAKNSIVSAPSSAPAAPIDVPTAVAEAPAGPEVPAPAATPAVPTAVAAAHRAVVKVGEITVRGVAAQAAGGGAVEPGSPAERYRIAKPLADEDADSELAGVRAPIGPGASAAVRVAKSADAAAPAARAP